jgi:hypothetical protein
MPPPQRALGNSVMFAGRSTATALAGPLISLLMVKFGWWQSCYLSSVLAFVIAVLWYLVRSRLPGAIQEHQAFRAAINW